MSPEPQRLVFAHCSGPTTLCPGLQYLADIATAFEPAPHHSFIARGSADDRARQEQLHGGNCQVATNDPQRTYERAYATLPSTLHEVRLTPNAGIKPTRNVQVGELLKLKNDTFERSDEAGSA